MSVPMNSALPPQVELVRVLAGLGDDLTANWSTVLADERWAEVAASLARLAVPGAVAGLARELGDAESGRLAGLLLERWARIGEAAPAPAAAILAPAIGAPGAELTVVVEGLEPGWTASWHGPVEPVEASGAVVRLRADPGASARVSVRVFGRTHPGQSQDPETSSGHRTILTAEAVLAAGPADEQQGSDGSDAAG